MRRVPKVFRVRGADKCLNFGLSETRKRVFDNVVMMVMLLCGDGDENDPGDDSVGSGVDGDERWRL